MNSALKLIPGKIISTLSNSRQGFHLEISVDMCFGVGDTVWIIRDQDAFARTEAVAYLHDVVHNETGETDAALSFSALSFAPDDNTGYRSVGHVPLYRGVQPVEAVDVPEDFVKDAAEYLGEVQRVAGNLRATGHYIAAHLMRDYAAALAHPRPNSPEIPDGSAVARPRPTADLGKESVAEDNEGKHPHWSDVFDNDLPKNRTREEMEAILRWSIGRWIVLDRGIWKVAKAEWLKGFRPVGEVPQAECDLEFVMGPLTKKNLSGYHVTIDELAKTFSPGAPSHRDRPAPTGDALSELIEAVKDVERRAGPDREPRLWAAIAGLIPTGEQAGEAVVYTYQFDYQTQSRYLLDGPVADGDKFVTLDAYNALTALLTQPRPMGVPEGWALAPVKLPALAVSQIKDMLEIDYGLHNYGARPLWAKLIQIVVGISMDDQVRINDAPGVEVARG